MIRCECCARADGNPHYQTYDPSCMYCGARYMRSTPPSTRKRAHVDHVLQVWGEQGHNPDTLMALATKGKIIHQAGTPKREKK